MSKGNRFIYEHHHYHHYKNENILFDKKTKNDENTSAKSSTSSLFSRKSKTKAKKLKKESRSNSLINNKQQFQHDDIIKNNISDPEAFTATFSTLVNRSNQSQVPNFNLSKIQTKKCMRSFRLRRAIKKQKNLLNNLDLFSNRKKSPIDDDNYLKNEINVKIISDSKGNLLSDDAEHHRQSTSKFYDLDDKLSNSSNFLGNGVFGDDEIENDFLSLGNSKTNLSCSRTNNRFLTDSSYFNYFDNNDSTDFGRSVRSSACDFDEITGDY